MMKNKSSLLNCHNITFHSLRQYRNKNKKKEKKTIFKQLKTTLKTNYVDQGWQTPGSGTTSGLQFPHIWSMIRC